MCQVTEWENMETLMALSCFLRFYKMSLQLTDPAVNFQLTLTGVIIATFMFVGNCSDPVSQMNPDHINIFWVNMRIVSAQEWHIAVPTEVQNDEWPNQ